MKPAIALCVLAFVAGCNPPSDPAPQVEPPTADAPAIDFAGWPSVTERPFWVEIPIAELCVEVTLDEERAMEAGRTRRHGPHYRPAIVVRVSPPALDAFRAGGPLTAGAVVVKEKHPDEAAATPPTAYAAMVKREAGYDPQNGDWEYLYEEVGPPRRVSRGRMETCIDCHRRAGGTDYLFRTYLKSKRRAD